MPTLPRKDSTIRDYKMSMAQRVQYNQMEREFLLRIEEGVITVEVAIWKYAKWRKWWASSTRSASCMKLVRPEDNPRLNLRYRLGRGGFRQGGDRLPAPGHAAISPGRFWRRSLIRPGSREEHEARQRFLIETAFQRRSALRIILLQCDASKYEFHRSAYGGRRQVPDHDLFREFLGHDVRDQIEDRIHRRGQTEASPCCTLTSRV